MSTQCELLIAKAQERLTALEDEAGRIKFRYKRVCKEISVIKESIVVLETQPDARAIRNRTMMTRKLLLSLVQEKPWTLRELGDKLGMSKQAIHYHMKKLRNEGLVRSNSSGWWHVEPYVVRDEEKEAS